MDHQRQWKEDRGYSRYETSSAPVKRSPRDQATRSTRTEIENTIVVGPYTENAAKDDFGPSGENTDSYLRRPLPVSVENGTTGELNAARQSKASLNKPDSHVRDYEDSERLETNDGYKTPIRSNPSQHLKSALRQPRKSKAESHAPEPEPKPNNDLVAQLQKLGITDPGVLATVVMAQNRLATQEAPEISSTEESVRQKTLHDGFKDPFFEKRRAFHITKVRKAIREMDMSAAKTNIAILKKMVALEMEEVLSADFQWEVLWTSEFLKVLDLMAQVAEMRRNSRIWSRNRLKYPTLIEEGDTSYALLLLVDLTWRFLSEQFESAGDVCRDLLRLVNEPETPTSPKRDWGVEAAAFYAMAKILESTGDVAEAEWYQTQVNPRFSDSWLYKWVLHCFESFDRRVSFREVHEEEEEERRYMPGTEATYGAR